jgi:hypothetical protein
MRLSSKGSYMIKKALDKKDSREGMVLVICLILLLVVSLIGIASISSSNSEMKISGNELKQTGSFYAAESGLEVAAASIINSYQTAGDPPNPLPSGSVVDGDFRYDYSTQDNGPAVQTSLSEGAFKGLYGLIKTFNINSTGIDSDHESSVTLGLVMQDALIPLFQFAVFYQNDLEIAPGPNMTLGGRVHSNSNVYLESNANLNIDSYLTAAGNIFHGRKPGSGQAEAAGNVFIKDRNGNYQNMKSSDGTWLDSRSSNWVDASMNRWGGLVEDSDHGISELNMPVVTHGDATNMIDRGSANVDSYENKAGLKLVEGQALYRQADGTWLNVTSTLVSQGVISSTTFRDSREARDIHSLDFDIQKLSASGYYPINGIVYSSQPTSGGYLSAMRIKNGATLPQALTVATNNPLYTLGNFNTVAKKPAAFLADAITILSGNWNDANSNQSLSMRQATATQVNASYLTGNTETGASGQGYCGGLENLPRFLEKWDGVTFTWRGSAVDLWYSRQATGAWSYGSNYTAPNRDWAFDPDLLDVNKLPPGTPMVNIVQRTAWNQQINNSL